MMKRLAFRAIATLQYKMRQVSSAKGAGAARGIWGNAPPPPQKGGSRGAENALLSIFRGIFRQKSQSWASIEVRFSIA